MLVVDASALCEAIASGPRPSGRAVRSVLATSRHWIAPAHIDVECLSAWRGWALRGSASWPDVERWADELMSAPVARLPVTTLARRIVELAPTTSAYDAAYVALAEHLDAPLVTLDQRLRRNAAVRCRIITPG